MKLCVVQFVAVTDSLDHVVCHVECSELRELGQRRELVNLVVGYPELLQRLLGGLQPVQTLDQVPPQREDLEVAQVLQVVDVGDHVGRQRELLASGERAQLQQ